MVKNLWLTSKEVMDKWGINGLSLLEILSNDELPCYFTGTLELVDSPLSLLKAKYRSLGLPENGDIPYAMLESLRGRNNQRDDTKGLLNWINKSPIDKLRTALDLVCFRAEDIESFGKKEPFAGQEKRLRPDQRHKQLCREKAEQLWRDDPKITITKMIGLDAIQVLFDGKVYNDDTLHNWIKDLAPDRSPGRRPKK